MANQGADWGPLVGIGLLAAVGFYFFARSKPQPFQLGDKVFWTPRPDLGIGTVVKVFFFDEANGWLVDVLFSNGELWQATPASQLVKV